MQVLRPFPTPAALGRTPRARAAVSRSARLSVRASSTEGAPAGKVVFTCQQPLSFGQQIKIVGAAEELGAWDLESAPTMEWSEGDVWTAEVLIPAGGIEFKLAVLNQDGSATWEEGDNRTLKVEPETAGSFQEASMVWFDTSATSSMMSIDEESMDEKDLKALDGAVEAASAPSGLGGMLSNMFGGSAKKEEKPEKEAAEAKSAAKAEAAAAPTEPAPAPQPEPTPEPTPPPPPAPEPVVESVGKMEMEKESAEPTPAPASTTAEPEKETVLATAAKEKEEAGTGASDAFALSIGALMAVAVGLMALDPDLERVVVQGGDLKAVMTELRSIFPSGTTFSN